MTAIGIINAERLSLIPRRHHAEHEFCFHLHDLMVTLLREAELSKAAHVSIKFSSVQQAKEFETHADGDPITCLQRLGFHDDVKRISINQLCLALFSDMLHFIHEALKALEKRKTTVAFALLRKPLRENLFFAAWMCANEDEFFKKFADSPSDQMESEALPKAKRVQILADAIKQLDFKSFLAADLIYSIIYEKVTDRGFAILFDKAMHLVTSRGLHLRTEEMNLNFIFKNPLDNDVYDFVYLRLAYLLVFALSVQIALYSRMKSVEKSFRNWVLMVALGSYHALFGEGRSPLVDGLNQTLKEFLSCPHCKSRVQIHKSESAKFFIMQTLHCRSCGNDFEFPLFWLLSKTEWDLLDKP